MNISASQVREYQRCQRRWYYRYVRGLRPLKREKALDYGSWGHYNLAAFYRSAAAGADLDGALKAMALAHDEYRRRLVGEYGETDLRDLSNEVFAVCSDYALHWGLPGETVVAVERDDVIPIPGTHVSLRLVTDLVLRHRTTGEVWVVDHKFQRNLRDDIANVTLDTQFGFYAWAYSQLYPGEFAGIVYNGILQGPKEGQGPQDRYRRELITFGQQHLAAIERELVAMAQEIGNMKEYYPRTMTKQCSWDCPFLDLCVAELRGGDAEWVLQMQFEPNHRGR